MHVYDAALCEYSKEPVPNKGFIRHCKTHAGMLSIALLQVYATSMAMLVTTVVSVLFFGLQPSLQLLLGIVTASISLVLYYVSPALLLETGKAQRLPK